jgi:hypothetical protein
MIFMFDAGRNSFSALREYNVSRVAASTMRTPQCAFANSGAFTALSIDNRSLARSSTCEAMGLDATPVAGVEPEATTEDRAVAEAHAAMVSVRLESSNRIM